MYVYIQSETNPAIRFEVIEYDKETGMGKLKGGYGAIIIRNIRKEELTKRGYKLIQSEKPMPLTPRPNGDVPPPKPKVEEEE